MQKNSYNTIEKKVIIRIRNRICEDSDELLTNKLFIKILKNAIDELQKHKSSLLNIFGTYNVTQKHIKTLVSVLFYLAKIPLHLVGKLVENSDTFLKDPMLLNDFVEYLYNYWRSFDRFIICDSAGERLDKRPFRTFNVTIGKLTPLIRGVYRDIQENITGNHPRIYRQVPAGAEIACIALPMELQLPQKYYQKISDVLVIRQMLINPPLILNPPNNKRTGTFEKVDTNPLNLIDINPNEWLCYPAKVGTLTILIYFHERFYELGFSLCNLFELAGDEDLKKKPDAVYFYGVPGTKLEKLGVFPTVFYEDTKNSIMIAACPNDDQFGYFGYLKKMVLTMHNIIMMKQDIFPFHGALLKISTKNRRENTILIIGDTGAGKSETIEAFREIGNTLIQDMLIIADDMGSLHLTGEDVTGYGTEIGAFLRLDDLKPGYAFGQIDRAIIMNPNQINSRIILPVTTYYNLSKGHKINIILYANNYENLDEEHPIIEQFLSAEEAIKVFRKGNVMSKGTTTSSGLVHSYFANIFGPTQYKELHNEIAKKYFSAFFEHNIFVGQIRTRLGIGGMERKGPEKAARELLKKFFS